MTPARRRLPALLGLGLLLLVGLPRDSVRAAEEAEDSPAQLTVVDYAASKIGARYAWSAAGPNVFDCSGFVQFVFANAGTHLAHYTDDQAAETLPVSPDEAQPGDLVFFYGWRDFQAAHFKHVGIYLGDGQMIDAEQRGGVQVRALLRTPMVFRRVRNQAA